MKVTILMSDTGGGHRSVATAVESALVTEQPEISVELVDGLLDYCLLYTSDAADE